MRILLLGAAGMLGRALGRVQRATGRHELVPYDRLTCDVTDPGAVSHALTAASPDVVFLCAAYTNVDGAEADPGAAMRVNGDGPGIVAAACARARCPLTYVSTDYVFDGEKVEPYVEDDAPGPLSVYGKSKLLGEERVRAARGEFLIARTSWLFGPEGKHFVDAILNKARAGGPLRVVTDQVGAPTYSIDLARALFALAERGARGVVHATNAGACSWHAFATRIVARAGLAVPVEPITAAELNRPARRPRNSRLDGSRLRALGVEMPPWEDALDRYLALAGVRGGAG